MKNIQTVSHRGLKPQKERKLIAFSLKSVGDAIRDKTTFSNITAVLVAVSLGRLTVIDASLTREQSTRAKGMCKVSRVLCNGLLDCVRVFCSSPFGGEGNSRRNTESQ